MMTVEYLDGVVIGLISDERADHGKFIGHLRQPRKCFANLESGYVRRDRPPRAGNFFWRQGLQVEHVLVGRPTDQVDHDHRLDRTTGPGRGLPPKSWGSVRPPMPSVPILRKFRRVNRSQNEGPGNGRPCSVSMHEAPNAGERNASEFRASVLLGPRRGMRLAKRWAGAKRDAGRRMAGCEGNQSDFDACRLARRHSHGGTGFGSAHSPRRCSVAEKQNGDVDSLTPIPRAGSAAASGVLERVRLRRRAALSVLACVALIVVATLFCFSILHVGPTSGSADVDAHASAEPRVRFPASRGPVRSAPKPDYCAARPESRTRCL